MDFRALMKGDPRDIVPEKGLESELWRIDWKKLGLSYCNVYVITTDSRTPCKIGYARDINARLWDLQISHWRELLVPAMRWFPDTPTARAVEKEAHKVLEQRAVRLRGEWFDVRVGEATTVIDWAAASLGFEARSDIPNDGVRDEVYRLLASVKMKSRKKA